MVPATSRPLRLVRRLHQSVGGILAVTLVILMQSTHASANVLAVVNKQFSNTSDDPLTFTASGTFDFFPGFADIEGMTTFSKEVTLAGNLAGIPVQHILIGDWDDTWSLTKIGFAAQGGLMGFDPSEVTFGDVGTFDVDFDMLDPLPGESGEFDFTVDVPITMTPIGDVAAILEPLAANNPDVQIVIDAIDASSGGFVPVAVTSLHVIPEPAAGTLFVLVLMAGIACRVRAGQDLRAPVS